LSGTVTTGQSSEYPNTSTHPSWFLLRFHKVTALLFQSKSYNRRPVCVKTVTTFLLVPPAPSPPCLITLICRSRRPRTWREPRHDRGSDPLCEDRAVLRDRLTTVSHEFKGYPRQTTVYW